MSIAVRAESLGKLYLIGHRQQAAGSLRESLMNALREPLRRLRGHSGAVEDDTIWALKDVSFEVSQGEVMGIIGRNGAGKSTLLKVLARITEPTEGRAEIRGRVGSLLEVGTGFHPELTGRENIFLNAAILGMKRAEVRRRFDEIVDFAEIEKFLDTAVKHYSSGMYMRLAFAVAAHLDTDILFVDEVLAVGDAAFQKKCLGKMGEVTKQGRTVLFVSHSMPAMQQLCSRCVLLARGGVEFDGPVDEAIDRYLSANVGTGYTAKADPTKPTITAASAEWQEADEQILLRVTFESPFPLHPPILGTTLYDTAGVPVFGTNNNFEWSEDRPESMQAGVIEVRISTRALRPGTYHVSLWLSELYEDYCNAANALTVEVGGPLPSGRMPPLSIIGRARLLTNYSYHPALRGDGQPYLDA